jgi:hypothetical protein
LHYKDVLLRQLYSERRKRKEACSVSEKFRLSDVDSVC